MEIKKGFTVEHKINKALGLGHVIGGGMIQDIVEQKLVTSLKVLVIWENKRNPSPCIHEPKELEWIQTEEDYQKSLSEIPDIADVINVLLENGSQPATSINDAVNLLVETFPDYFEDEEEDQEDEDEEDEDDEDDEEVIEVESENTIPEQNG